MSRIPVRTLEDAPEDTRQTLAKLSRRTGKLLTSTPRWRTPRSCWPPTPP